jgi:hypothetical protein
MPTMKRAAAKLPSSLLASFDWSRLGEVKSEVAAAVGVGPMTVLGNSTVQTLAQDVGPVSSDVQVKV